MVQNIIVLTIVFVALGYVIFSVFRKREIGNQSKCGSCSGCSGCELRKSINNKSSSKVIGCY